MSDKSMVLFGVSNMLSDIYDCAHALDRKITKIVLNAPEEKRERTKGFRERLRELKEDPEILDLSDFIPGQDEEYFVVPTTPKKALLINLLNDTYPGMQFASLIHPAAYISPYATIGDGVFIGVGSVVAPGVVLGFHVFVNRCVSIGHDTVVHEYARLQPGSNIGGHVTIHAGATIGMGASIIEERVVGQGAVVAAGAAVIRDVDPMTLVAGVPAVFKKLCSD